MRGRFVLLTALLTGLLSGCAWQEKRSSWMPRLRPFRGVEGEDVVQMDVALLEARIGDNYINGSLWELADEQILPLEKKSILEQNGFRIGQVGSSPPSELLMLLTSPRSCANPRRIQLRAGKKAPPLVLGPKRTTSRFDIRRGNEKKAVELLTAEHLLKVEATLTEDGRTKIRFTPEVTHGEISAEFFRPKPDRSGWMMQPTQSKESYPTLEWEVTLSPGEYLVIGGRYNKPGTLGHACFVRKDEAAPVQRLLVIRTTRTVPGVGEDDAKEEMAPPIALQANRSAARGTAR